MLEHRWDFTTAYEASIQAITVLEIRDGKIVTESWYYQAPFDLPAGKPLEPKPLTSAPGPADTAAAAEAVALKYAAALQAKDAAAVAALSAPKIAFMDTAASAVGSGPGQVQAHYARIFKKPADLAFTDLRYAFGPGWATLIWVADSLVLVGGERARRDHARDPRRQDRPRDALLQRAQACRSGSNARAAPKGRGSHEEAKALQMVRLCRARAAPVRRRRRTGGLRRLEHRGVHVAERDGHADPQQSPPPPSASSTPTRSP